MKKKKKKSTERIKMEPFEEHQEERQWCKIA
jgi:hypothetical protein